MKKVFDYYKNGVLEKKVVEFNLEIDQVKKEKEELISRGYKKSDAYFDEFYKKNEEEITIEIRFC